MPQPLTKSISRTFEVLNRFIETQEDLGVSELSRVLKCTKSAVHRILVSLEEANYLVSDPASHRYRLGFKAIQLGLAAQQQNDLHRVAYHRMVRLRDATNETITLGILVGDERVYLEQVESPQVIRQSVEVGIPHPLYIGASGKTILAFLPTERQDRILVRAVGKSHADGTQVDLDRLRRDLAEIRQRGYGVSQSERLQGAAAIAAPIFNSAGEVIGNLSVAGLAFRLTPEKIAQFAPLLVSASSEISIDLGYVASNHPHSYSQVVEPSLTLEHSPHRLKKGGNRE